MINKKTMGDLKFTMLGNTATHMPQASAASRDYRDGHAPDEEVDRGDAIPEVPEFLQQSSTPVAIWWTADVGRHADLQHKAVTTTDRLSSEAATGGTRWSRPSHVQLAC